MGGGKDLVGLLWGVLEVVFVEEVRVGFFVEEVEGDFATEWGEVLNDVLVKSLPGGEAFFGLFEYLGREDPVLPVSRVGLAGGGENFEGF